MLKFGCSTVLLLSGFIISKAVVLEREHGDDELVLGFLSQRRGSCQSKISGGTPDGDASPEGSALWPSALLKSLMFRILSGDSRC